MGSNPHYVDIVKLVLDQSPSKKILDVGISYGLYDVVLKQIQEAEIYGIDHPFNIDTYCRYPIKKDIPATGCDIQIESLPYPDNFFDVVIASEIMEHLLVPPVNFLRKLHLVTKSGGKLVFSTPNFLS
jgi:2-polyprenyl-3-methyl-5-hydroxy-6-metoxy-1,4-benzoquinol methylase